MSRSRMAVAGALLVAAGAAHAGTEVSAAWVNDYDWRGVPQSAGQSAVQLGATFSAANGFYVGTWGSSLVSGSEIDAFLGFAGGDPQAAFGYDLGVNYYGYTNASEFNFYEAYAGISKGPLAAKLWYSPGLLGTDGSAFYLEGKATIALGAGFSLLAHVGYSLGDGVADTYGGDDHYLDWSAGFGYDVSHFSTYLKYSDGGDNPASNKQFGRILFGISTTLPWSQ
ncbi:MAG: TorF family putative porin [Steroidobacteraceae bacterium]